MKRFIFLALAFFLSINMLSCGSEAPTVYKGTFGIYDAEVFVKDGKATLSYTITEKSYAMTIKNIVKITGDVVSSEKNLYTADFAGGNAVITLKYEVSGKDPEGYHKSLADLLMMVVKTDEDKALVEKIRLGEEISFGIDSALYTSLTGMPKTLNIKLYDNDNTFKILN